MGLRDAPAVTRTRPPAVDVHPEVMASPGSARPAQPARASAELQRIRRSLRRRAGHYRRSVRLLTRRVIARAVQTWRSSLQVRIGAITMVVAGTVVIIVSLV